jgi:glycosyltransferase involved in cell wall biosynthesis
MSRALAVERTGWSDREGGGTARTALVVATHPPGRGSGSGLRSLRTLEALRERFDRVDVVALASPGEDALADPAAILLPRPPHPQLPARLAALRYGGAYYAAERAAGPGLERLTAEGVIERRVDLIWVAQSLLARAVLDSVVGHRRVIDIDNVAGADRRRSAADRTASPVRRAFRLLSASVIAAEERRRCNRFDLVVLTSDLERRRLGPVDPPVAVVPNTVDEEPVVDAAAAPRRLLFVGSLDYDPNVDAVRTLVRAIMPRVRAVVPDAELDVAGRNPTAEVIALCAVPGVRLHADAPSLDPVYAQARLVVAPLRLGGGTRMKIVEALARGAPVVATPTAAEGLHANPGRDIVLADDADAFAHACIRLLEDPAAAAAIGAAGRAIWERDHRPEAARAAIRTLLDELGL